MNTPGTGTINLIRGSTKWWHVKFQLQCGGNKANEPGTSNTPLLPPDSEERCIGLLIKITWLSRLEQTTRKQKAR